MVFKGLIAATAAVGMMTAPVVAAAQTAPVPATETVEGSASHGGRHGGFIIPLIALLAIILGILAATQSGRSDRPVTPG